MAKLTEFSLGDTVAVLSRTPASLDALLRGLPSGWVRSDEGKDTWSAFDIVGHLIVGERTDWMPRVRIILENGEARTFDPFDRFAQAKETSSVGGSDLIGSSGDVGRTRPYSSASTIPRDGVSVS